MWMLQFGHFVRETHVKRMPIKREARETAKSLGITHLKSGRGWCERFMRCEGLSLRLRTSVCQEISAEFQEKLLNFQRYVIKEETKLR